MPHAVVRPHERLCTLRLERHLSIDQLADLAGVRPATICELERGTTHIPQRRTLAKLAAAYGLSLDEFRRQIGMHGHLDSVPAPRQDPAAPPRLSPRAEQIASWVDTLPVEEQVLIERLCGYLHARRYVNLAPDALVGDGHA